VTTTSYQVQGMTCEHCVNAVREEVGKVAGVSGVDVDLATGRVEVRHAQPLSGDDVRAAVEEAGYELVGT